MHLLGKYEFTYFEIAGHYSRIYVLLDTFHLPTRLSFWHSSRSSFLSSLVPLQMSMLCIHVYAIYLYFSFFFFLTFHHTKTSTYSPVNSR